MKRLLPILVGLCGVAGSGAIQGHLGGRWSTSRELAARSEALPRVPKKVGGWTGHDLTLDRRTIRGAGIDGYLMRRYDDAGGAGSVTVLIVCGRPGPISVHTPEVCYQGAGYEQSGETARVALGPGRPDEFWDVAFAKDGALKQELLIMYAWSDGGPWRASGRPRLDFGGSPFLYKMYVVREGEAGDGRDPGGRRLGFLKEFLDESSGPLGLAR